MIFWQIWQIWLMQPMRPPSLVRLGKERWDTERLLRLAGEAVIGRLGDIATKFA